MRRRLSALVIALVGLTAFAQDGQDTSALVDDLASAAARMVREAGLRDPERLHLSGISSRGRSTPLGELFSLTAGNRIMSQVRGPLLVAETEVADYVLEGEAHVLDDRVVLGFRLLRTEDAVFVSGFDRTIALTPGLRSQLLAGGPQPTAGDPFEPNDDPYSGFELRNEIPVDGATLAPRADVDWFFIDVSTAERGTQLSVETTGATDTYLEIYGPDDPGILIAENDDGLDQNAMVTLGVENPGRYYILVRGFDSSTTGPYQLYADVGQVELDRFEPDDTRQTAGDLRVGQASEEHTLNPGGDVDWVRIEVPESALGRVLEVETGGVLDTRIALYGPLGELITDDDDSGIDGNARVSHLLDRAGPYWAEIRGYDTNTSGDYLVEARLVDARLDAYEPDDDFESARELFTDAPPQEHTFTTGSDADYLSFRIEETSYAVLETWGEMDTYLELFDSDRTLLADDDDGGSGTNAKLSMELSPGLYYLRVTQIGEMSLSPYSIGLQSYRR